MADCFDAMTPSNPSVTWRLAWWRALSAPKGSSNWYAWKNWDPYEAAAEPAAAITMVRFRTQV